MSVNHGHEKENLDRSAELEERVRALLMRSPAFATVVGVAIDESGIMPRNTPDTTQHTPEAKERDWYARRVLFVTGPHASGKSAVVRTALKEDDGFASFDTGPLLREYHHSDAPDEPFGQWVGRNETEFGRSFTDELLTHHIRTAALSGLVEHPSGLIVIGNRSYGGVAYLQQTLVPSDSRLLYVDAPKDLLYERYKSREGKQDISPAEFDALLEADEQLGLSGLVNRADHHITNDDELAFVAQHLRDYVEGWQPPAT